MTDPDRNTPEDLQLVRMRDVVALTSMRKTTIYELISNGDFPRPLKIGVRTSAWLRVEVENWIRTRAAAREKLDV